MTYYQIVVSNVGTVYTDASKPIAYQVFDLYVILSKEDCGRVGGQKVTLFEEGQVLRSYNPPSGEGDDDHNPKSYTLVETDNTTGTIRVFTLRDTRFEARIGHTLHADTIMLDEDNMDQVTLGATVDISKPPVKGDILP